MGVGLKLLGIYFGVSGVAGLWNMLLVLIAAPSRGANIEGLGAIGILQPAVYLLAAFLLVCRTRTCACWCGEPEPEKPAGS